MKDNSVLLAAGTSTQTLPASSRLQFGRNPAAPACRLTDDGRRIMTLWQALVWAFRTECVAAAMRAALDEGPMGGGSKTSAAVQALELGFHIPGPTAREPLRAHEDAVMLYHLARDLETGTAVLLARCANTGEPPSWSVTFEPTDMALCRPVIDLDSRRPKVTLHPIARRPWYCPVEYDGLAETDKEARRARARETYGLFFAGLVDLAGLLDRVGPTFSRLCVRGLGVAAEPWARG